MSYDLGQSAVTVLIASGVLLAVAISPLRIDKRLAEAGEVTQEEESDWQKAKRETGEAASSVGTAVKETVSEAWDATKETCKKAWDATKEAASETAEAVKEGVDDAVDTIKGD
jgi:gas vesicle protein